MNYRIAVIPRIADLEIPYDKKLENLLGATAAQYINENYQYPGNYVIYSDVSDSNHEAQGPSARWN